MVSNFHDVDDLEGSDASFSHLELMKYKIKNDDAKKILRLLDSTISKIEIIAYLEYLKDNMFNVELTEEEKDAVNIFCDLWDKAYADYKPYESKQNVSDIDAFIEFAAALKWKFRSSALLPSGGLKDLCCHLRAFELIIVEKFSKTPTEIKKEQKVIKDLKREVDDLSKAISTLKTDLKDSEHQKREIKRKFHRVIEELQLEITRIEWLATDMMDSNVKQADKAIQKAEQEGQGTVMKLDQQVTQLKGALDECMNSNLEEEITLRKNRRQIQEEITDLIKKYDIDMGNRQSRYDYAYKEYMDEIEKEKRLSVQVVELKRTYDVIMEEMQKKEAEREKREAELQTKTTAAIVIQKNWRGYRTRKMLKGGDKKDKPKKAGKKGKKK